MTRLAHWLAGLSLFIAVFSVDARVIFDNGVSDVTDAVPSDREFPLISADDFVLAPGSNTITGIRWTGIYAPTSSPPAADDFRIEIFADNAGAPIGSALPIGIDIVHMRRADSGVDIAGYDVLFGKMGSFDIYNFQADIGPTTLAANTTFWLSISNNTSADTDDYWNWGTGSNPGNSFAGADEGAVWLPFGLNHDFTLTGVPEPATAMLLGIGLAGFCFATAMRARVASPRPSTS